MVRKILTVTLMLGIFGSAAAQEPVAENSDQTSNNANQDQNAWGEWNQPAAQTQTYGVGIEGNDEHLLNTLDGSNLMDYQPDSEPGKYGSRLAPTTSSGNTVPTNDQDLQKEAEHFLIESLEEKLLEDLSK